MTVRQAFVERHKVGLFAVKTSSEVYLVFVQGEVRQAAPELKDSLFGVALRRAVLVFAVLACGLVCPRIFKFKGKNRQTVHEQHNIYFQPRICNRKSLLTGKRELILRIFPFRNIAVGCRWLRIEQSKVNVVNIHAFAKHLYYAESLNILGDSLWQFCFQVLALVFVQRVLLRGFE